MTAVEKNNYYLGDKCGHLIITKIDTLATFGSVEAEASRGHNFLKRGVLDVEKVDLT